MKKIRISDHAVLRYLERTECIDIQRLKKTLLNKQMRKKIRCMGDGKYAIAGGLRMVVRDNTVVTVLPK